MRLFCNLPCIACRVVLDKHHFAATFTSDMQPPVVFWPTIKNLDLPCQEHLPHFDLERYPAFACHSGLGYLRDAYTADTTLHQY